MASEPILEIELFLKPISDDNPTGPDLREQSDADYASVKAARRKIVSLTKAARFDPSVETELNDQWKLIRKLAPSILKKKSKDLEVASWLAESLLKLSGFPGLRDGLEITKALVENFWDNLYPEPDEDGLETRVYPLISLNGEEGAGTMILPIKNAPMLPDSDVLLSFTSLTRIRETLKIDDLGEREAKLNEIGITQQALQAQIDAVTPDAASSFLEDLQQTQDNWANLGQLIDDKCQEGGSNVSLPVSGIRGALEEVRELYEQIMRSKLSTPEETPEETGSETADDSSQPAVTGSSGAAVSRGPTQSREDAIRQLQSVASFFRTTEPHSPISGVIERAAEWARLPLPQLLAQLIPDAGARMHYSLMTGVEIGEEAVPAAQVMPTTSAPQSAPEESPSASEGSDWNF